MTAPIRIPELPDLPDLPGKVMGDSRWKRFALSGVAINLAIWGLAWAALTFLPPSYTSEWAMILPGTGARSSFELKDLGSASSTADSPYLSPSLDPRANYKLIAESDGVLEVAARRVGLTSKQFGKSRIKLPEQTSILEFAIVGKSPQQARRKSEALYTAIQERLTALRGDEENRRELGVQRAILDARKQLTRSQRELLAYSARTGLVNQEQFRDMAGTIEALNKQRSEVSAQEQQSRRQLDQLTGTLGLSPRQAASAFALQADPLFQDQLKTYSESSALLIDYAAKWGANHPLVVKETARRRASRQGMLERGRFVTDQAMNEADFDRLRLLASGTGSSGRESLFQQLVVTQVQQQGYLGQVAELTRQIDTLRGRLKLSTQQQSDYDALQRTQQVAEAIFTSTLARVSTSKSDIFASYPLVQMLAGPDTPESPSFPNPIYILAGATAASVLVTGGLGLLYARRERKGQTL